MVAARSLFVRLMCFTLVSVALLTFLLIILSLLCVTPSGVKIMYVLHYHAT
jgi:hypothetical protein